MNEDGVSKHTSSVLGIHSLNPCKSHVLHCMIAIIILMLWCWIRLILIITQRFDTERSFIRNFHQNTVFFTIKSIFEMIRIFWHCRIFYDLRNFFQWKNISWKNWNFFLMIFQQKLPDIHNNKETSKNVIFGEKTVKFFFVRIFCGHRIFYDVRNFFPNHKWVREYHIFFSDHFDKNWRK